VLDCGRMWASVLFALSCAVGNLAAGRPAVRSDAGDAAGVTGERHLSDGAAWDSPGSVTLPAGGAVTIDLGEARPVRALAIQADNDDVYVVEGSADAQTWRSVWSAPSVRGAGLRTRRHRLDAEADVRFLRIRPHGGDGAYAVASLEVYCEPPADWPSEPSRLSPIQWWRDLDNDSILAVKGAVAAAGALLLLVGAVLRWRGKEGVLRRSRDGLLALLGIVSFCSWFNLFRFHFDDTVHLWDIYHYYIGAKYFPELGYSAMYECTTVAEAEVFGPASVAGRTITNLVTNQIESAAPVVADPARCTSRFSEERWRDFKADVRFFHGQFTRDRWTEVLHDHGYNGTPVWGALGRAIASLGPASEDQLHLLAAIDPILIAVMWGFVVWAFGWRVACVGLLWWGTNYPSRYYWNGGAFLRMDWLALAMAGICLVKKGRPGLGGFALTYSALLRVFPGFILVGLFAKVVVGWVRARRIQVGGEMRRFVLGAAIAVGVLVPVSLILAPGRGGLAALGEFIDNSKKHLETPLTNNMGWKTLVAYQTETRARVALGGDGADPFGAWKAARRHVFAERLPFFLAGLAAFLGLLAWAAAGQPDWVALTLGVGLIPFATELTCYYYSFLLAYAFLWPRRPLIGVGLLAVAAASCFVPRIAWWDDARYFDISLQVIVFVALATILVRAASGTRDTDR